MLVYHRVEHKKMRRQATRLMGWMRVTGLVLALLWLGNDELKSGVDAWNGTCFYNGHYYDFYGSPLSFSSALTYADSLTVQDMVGPIHCLTGETRQEVEERVIGWLGCDIYEFLTVDDSGATLQL